MDPIDIKGLDLKIDASVHQICMTSNNTSSYTRNILYILVLVSLVSVCAILNTNQNNWSQNRINHINDQLTELDKYPMILGLNTPAGKRKEEFLKKLLEIELRSQVENCQTVKIPIIGSAFDINNLSLVSGAAFVTLLYILSYTFGRESNNLKIALKAISERYPDDANKKEFFPDQMTVKSYPIPPNTTTTDFEAIILARINYTRRQHHYNFLSMNEIFNLPSLNINSSSRVSTHVTNFFSYTIVLFPLISYILVMHNDFMTIEKGIALNLYNTIKAVCFSMSFVALLMVFTGICVARKIRIYNLYNTFRDSGYRYPEQD